MISSVTRVCCFVRSLVAVLVAYSVVSVQAQDQDSEALYTSPDHAVRIEQHGEELWVIYAENSGQRGKGLEAKAGNWDLGSSSLFQLSADEKWLVSVTNIHHRGLQERELYENRGDLKFGAFKANNWFSENAERYALQNGPFKESDFVDEQGYDRFHSDFEWSSDSTRLLIGIEDSNFYFYFNTRKRAFEQTPYLRAINKIARHSPNDPRVDFNAVHAEPMALPPEAELNARYAALDEKLNQTYNDQLDHAEQKLADSIRDDERKWLRARDEGLETYLSVAPASQRVRCRLWFLADATAARIDWLIASQAQRNQ
jgi:hypothetical protein